MGGLICWCGRPAGDVSLCNDCADRTEERLWRVGALLDDLEIAFCRLARIGRDSPGIRVRGAETPLAFNWPAAESRVLLAATIDHVVAEIAQANLTVAEPVPGFALTDPKDPARIYRRRSRTVGLATWLVEHLQWLRIHPRAGELVDLLDRAMDDARRTIDSPAARSFAGPCGESTEDGPCPADLYAPTHSVVVTCPDCGAVHDMGARREWLLAAAQDQLVTAGEASRALPGLLGEPVTASMIRGYVHRGRLTQHPPRADAARDARGVRPPTYRLGDIVEVLALVKAEQAAKQARKRTA